MNNYTPKQLKKQLIKFEEEIEMLAKANRFLNEEIGRMNEKIIKLRIENEQLKETINEIQS